MPLDTYFPPIGLEDSSFTRQEAENLLKFRSFQQQPVVYVAASDTPSALAYMAKFKCDGLADEVTVQEAIASLPDGGGEIVLLIGTYLTDDSITVPDNVVMSGQGPGTIVRQVSDPGSGSTVIENADSVGGNSNITIRDLSVQVDALIDSYAIWLDNVTVGLITGLSINAANGAQAREAIRAQNCDRVLIENSELVGFGDSVRIGGFGTGNPSVDCEIRNCLMYGAGSDGVHIESDSSRIRVIGNRFDSSGSHGIDVSGTACIISNNVIVDPGIEGIDVDGTDNVIIGNTISNGSISVSANNNVITGNRLYGGGDGIEILGSRNTVVGNSIDNTDTLDGIYLTGSFCTIQGNNISFAGRDGIRIDGGDYNNVVGNYIYEADERGIHMLGACDSCTVDSNYVYNASASSAGTYDAIFVANISGMNHNSIKNNVVKGSINHRYGIRLDGTNVNNTLVSNNELVFSGATGAYSDAGTGTDTLGGNRT